MDRIAGRLARALWHTLKSTVNPQENKIGRGGIGALLGFIVCFAAMMGAVFHQCIPANSGYIPLMVVEFMLWGFAVYVPASVIGFVIGLFAPLRVLLALGIALMIAAFAYGWATALNYCLPV